MGIMKRVLGKEHPLALNAIGTLAINWKSLGRDDEAVTLMVQCAKGRITMLGDDHRDTKAAIRKLNEWGVSEF
jgi:hypothetical protein